MGRVEGGGMKLPTNALPFAIGHVAVLNVCFWLGACAGGGGGAVDRVPAAIHIKISPASEALVPGETKQFRAIVSQSDNAGVTWSVDGGAESGTISSEGLYTAPDAVPTPDTVTIRATS